jgi:hypothetical protein
VVGSKADGRRGRAVSKRRNSLDLRVGQCSRTHESNNLLQLLLLFD